MLLQPSGTWGGVHDHNSKSVCRPLVRGTIASVITINGCNEKRRVATNLVE